MKMIFILMQIRIIFKRKTFALSLVLGTREWPIDFEVKESIQSVVRLLAVLQVGDLMRSMTLLAYKSMEGSLEEVWTDMGAISVSLIRE